MKSVFIIVVGIGLIVLAYEEYNENGPTVQVMPAKQVVPIGQQPKDPTKPWCYEQQDSQGNKYVVCH